MNAVATNRAFWIGLIAVLAALYVLPTMIALIRHVENIGLVVYLNCFPIAWPAALLLACMMPRGEDRPGWSAGLGLLRPSSPRSG